MHYNIEELSNFRPYWEPWTGCRAVSAGCKNCFICDPEFKFYGYDKVNFTKYASGTIIVTTPHSDFFLEEADKYRQAAWQYIKYHPDFIFLIITKRIERFYNNLPEDWDNGYENVIIEVTTENQEMADKRLPIFRDIPAKHKWLSVAPFIENLDLSKYLAEGWIERIEATGEKAIGASKNAETRELKYEWVENLSNQCKQYNTSFCFTSCGSNFKYNNKTFHDHCGCFKSCLAQGLELDNKVKIEFKLEDSIKVME